MTFASWRQSCKPIFKEFKILTVPNVIILKTLLWVQSNFETLMNENYHHEHNTRSRNLFQYPIHHLRLTERTPNYVGKKLFNKLPLHIKSSIRTSSFKSSLTEFLLEKGYYSVNEFLTDNLLN